jgi:hypothetical protein
MMVFGNWKVTADGIAWNSNGFNHFLIPKASLNATRMTAEGVLYEWILLATDEDWLTQNDLYDLNFAFVYAMAKFNMGFNYDIFDDTLEVQYEQFDDEEDEEEEF